MFSICCFFRKEEQVVDFDYQNVILFARTFFHRVIETRFLANQRAYFLRTIFQLTNRMWFSVDCTLIDSDKRHHIGQNLVDSLGAAFYLNIKGNELKEIFVKTC